MVINHERSDPRFAHTDGFTSLCFSEDGRFIITCGSEGDMRVWNGINDDDPVEKCVGEQAFAVVQKGDKLYVGSDRSNVQIFTFPDVELDGVLTRFTAPATTVNASKDGSLIVAGSSDMEIHVVEASTLKVTVFSGHTAPILDANIDPKMEYMASSSCDGSVRVWRISDQTVANEWKDVIKRANSFQFAESLCHTSWEPNTGRLFAIPFSDEIKLFQRSTWITIMTFTDPEIKGYSLTAWSFCGRFLVTSTTEGTIVVWHTLVNRKISLSKDRFKTNIYAIAWNPLPEERQIAFCNYSGELISIDNCYPLDKEESGDASETEATEDIGVPRSFGTQIEDDDDADVISLNEIKSAYDNTMQEIDEFGDDDAHSVKSSSTHHGPLLPVANLQLPFQPTSTPVHLQRRFMVFNDVGYVKQTKTEDEEDMIDVDFHDASIHHSFRINNILKHTMAALNSEALVLACEKIENIPSKVVCVLLNAWDGNREWNVPMMENESIEAVALGRKWIAVVTSFRFVRIFTLSGVQREVLIIPGPVVCVNAFENLLFVVYHCAFGITGDQNMNFIVYQITSKVITLSTPQQLPLSSKSTLKWIGFSDSGNPCALDSEGVLSLYILKNKVWRPICRVDDQCADTPNHHFVVGVSEERQNIRSILCIGSYYPSTTPHPFITEIEWQVPVCEISLDKGMLEEKLWRNRIADECVETSNKELLATALKLIALACQTSHEMRVNDLCEFTDHKDLIDLALRYATKSANNLLVDKLSILKSEQMKRRKEEEFNNLERLHQFANGNNIGMIQSSSYTEDNKLSQDLFPESQRSHDRDDNERDLSLEGSLIAKVKKRKSLSEQKNEIMTAKKTNPFKKTEKTVVSVSQPNNITSDNGFSDWFNKEKSNLSQEFKNASEESLTKIATKIYGSLDTSLAFPAWFKNEKSECIKEFPDLSDGELAKMAAKMYRIMRKHGSQSQTKMNQNDTEDKPSSDTNDDQNRNISKKRKQEENVDDVNGVKKSTSFKLQQFVYKK